MLDIYIYDGKASVCEKIKKICEQYLMSRNYENEIGYCGTSTEELLRIIRELSCNSIFMLEAGKALRSLSDELRDRNVAAYIIIFINDLSDITEFMTLSVKPSGIIIKPPEGGSIRQLLDEIESDLKRNSGKTGTDVFVFRTKSREYSISLDNIIFFESREKKMFIRTRSQEFSYYGTFSEVESQVDENFVRVHKSFMINKRHAAEVDRKNNTIIMDDGTAVFYSRTYKESVSFQDPERQVL